MFFHGLTKPISRLRQNLTSFLLIPLMCLSLVMMGGLLWVNNSWALILDNDANTSVNLGIFLGGHLNDDPSPELDDDDDGVVPVAGGTLFHGNGDQDDNKEEAFLLRVNCGSIVEPPENYQLFAYSERRLVLAYIDFGHLKVMPAGDGIANTIPSNPLTALKGSRVLRAAFCRLIVKII